ncbi:MULTISPECIES: helix-turn-helix domain-containing protein [unclassified Streptomyces]|uniref:helix-turn-helix domain-containing protein n=1 Tax=unclassified Streptomyces TaxID=2593676 RepID=UPI000DAE1DD4|nr:MULTISPECIES: helix-turn-helix transcriptional regulator [unclassified Streptomyces]PZT76441.1 transcriptional regulator [Streptomyces sp. AC1-42W]PZT79602.1 transcriptional regulator [Streptomyces sp. AC1-42T]
MTSTPAHFGPELRRLRMEAELSLSDMAAALNYDKGYLSKVERGERSASPELARRCDAFLGANGELRRLVVRSDSDPDDAAAPADNLLRVGRREVLAAGTGSLIELGLKLGGPAAAAADPLLLSFQAQFDQLRKLGQSTAPKALLPLLETQTRLVVGLAAAASSATRAPALVLASRFAEFTGWMAQEAGNSAAALDWTDEAAELARAGGDPHLGSYALVRRALVTFYGGDAASTIALARRAQGHHLPPRVRGLAAQREAQGHALAGDERACLRSLDRARELLRSDGARGGSGPVLGTTHVTDPAAMTTGWCLYDLGRPAAAAEVLDRECRRLPAHALRTRARYGLRRSLAHAASGEVEHACTIAGELLGVMPAVPSATVNADVRRLARELARFRSNRAVRDLQPALARVLASAHA